MQLEFTHRLYPLFFRGSFILRHMFTPKSVSIILILLFIVGIASWSKLRFVDPEDHQEQRWRVDQYPGFKQNQTHNLAPHSAKFGIYRA